MSRLRLPKMPTLIAEAATLLSGQMLAQVITVAAYFILTRIYTPDDYCLFNIFYSYIEVLVIVSTCKYEVAVVAADSDAEARQVSRGALTINTAVSLLLLTVALALVLTHSLPGNFSQLGPIALLIPPMVFFCGTSRIYSFLFNRAHRYRQIALSETVNAASGSLLKILFGLLRMHTSGMPLGTVIGQMAANINYRLRLKRLPFMQGTAPAAVTAKQALLKHRNYPLYVAPKDLLTSFSANLPFLWLALYFQQAEVGLFGLALTFTFRPANILNGAFERALYARVAERVRQQQSVGHTIRRFLLILNAIAIPAAIAAWFVAEPLFTFLFGSQWVGTGIYVQALLPWILVMLSTMSLMFIPNVFGTQRTEFLFGLVLLALRIAACLAGLHAGSFILAIRLFAAASAAVCLALLVWYLWQVRRYERSLR